MSTLDNKIKNLKANLSAYDTLAIAFSGGVDSTFLLTVAKEALKERVIAVTAIGPNFAPDEIQFTKDFCRENEITHLIVNLSNEIMSTINENTNLRCYYCKKTIFSNILETVESTAVADGTNVDDNFDYRPGRKAIEELGVVSPLADAGFTKNEIRQALKAMNMEIWDKPAFACLASRVPYGEEITSEKLNTIYKAETFLRSLGFKQVRVRHHGDIARIEVSSDEISKFFDEQLMLDIDNALKELGFFHVALDLAGYSMGSLNLPSILNQEE